MKYSENLKALRSFLILLATQSFSALGSSMTSFTLVIWSYQQQGSALRRALLTVCSYAPYVIVSILAGAISDRWSKKKIMLVCDTFAALSRWRRLFCCAWAGLKSGICMCSTR